MKKTYVYKLATLFALAFFAGNTAIADVINGGVGAGVVQSEIQKQFVDDFVNKEVIEKKLDYVEAPKRQQKVKLHKKDTGEDIDPTFNIKTIQFEGNTIFSDKELAEIAEPLIGQEIYMDDIVSLAQAITKKYNYLGYITSFAYIPPQDIVDGTVKIRIIESKITGINVTGNKWTRPFYYKSDILNMSGVRKGKIFNTHDMDAAMKQINDKIYLNANMSVERTGEELEEAVVNLDVKDRLPITFNFSCDDHGRDLVGVNRARFTLTNENLSGFGDKLYAGTVLASGTTGVLAGYQVPISPYGTKLAFDYGFTHVNLGGNVAQQKISGNSESYMLRVIQPLKKSSNTDVEASVGIDFSNTNSTLGLNNVKMSDYSLRVVRSALYGTHDDKYGRTFGSLNLDFGMNAMGATQQKEGSADTAFQKYAATLIRLQKIPVKDSYMVFRLNGQYSPNNLYPVEQMQLGGYNSVRGYETGTLIGDYGFNGGVEFRTAIPGFKKVLPEKYKSISDAVKLLAFYDFGYIKTHGNIYDYTQSFMQSVGVGLNIYSEKGFGLNMAVGIPVGQRDYAQGGARFHFALSTDIDRWVYRRFKTEQL